MECSKIVEHHGVMTTILILQYVCLVSVLFWWWDREKMIMVGLIVVTSHDVTPRPTEYDATPALVGPGLALAGDGDWRCPCQPT